MVKFQGVFTALVTPFTADDKIDEKALRSMVKWQIDNKVDAIVPLGTTGESPCIMEEEYERILHIVVEEADNRVPIVAGVSSNSTLLAIKKAKQAFRFGVSAIMVSAPYYNKPQQEGIYEYFRSIHDEVALPIMIYNIPGRTGVNISDETIARLSELTNVKAIKESSGDLTRISRLAKICQKDFNILSGDDITALAALANGASGVVSVVANILPDLMTKLYNHTAENDFQAAREIHMQLMPMMEILFCETNPVPVKYAMSVLGLCNNKLRAPDRKSVV